MLHFLLYWYSLSCFSVEEKRSNIFINNVLYILCKFSVALFQDCYFIPAGLLFYIMFLILIVVSAQFSTLPVNSCYMHNFILTDRKSVV